MKTFSVIVPVYNSGKTLRELARRLSEQLGMGFELIFVNDGSRDDSWDVIKEICSKVESAKGINLMRNYGQHNALLCGIREAQADLIITIDDDLQNPPEEIPKLIEELEKGYDVVYGKPRQERHGIWRDLASKITKWVLQGAMGAATAGNVSAFRAFRTHLRDAFSNYRSPYVNIDVLLTWGTSKFSAVAVRHDARTEGVSNYTFAKLVTHALNMLTGFSTMPLQVASLIGFFFTVFGLVVLFFVIGRYLVQGGSPPGFPFLASIVAIFSGAQLFALGIIGEYLARMHLRMMERPTYTVRSKSERIA